MTLEQGKIMDKQEINNAISEHAMWKLNLQALIKNGKFDAPVEACTDSECDFGKWFYGASITTKQRASAHYKQVKQLHGEFHQVAAEVARLALNGEKEEAEKLMGFEGAYTAVSNRLIEALVKWKENFSR